MPEQCLCRLLVFCFRLANHRIQVSARSHLALAKHPALLINKADVIFHLLIVNPLEIDTPPAPMDGTL